MRLETAVKQIREDAEEIGRRLKLKTRKPHVTAMRKTIPELELIRDERKRKYSEYGIARVFVLGHLGEKLWLGKHHFEKQSKRQARALTITRVTPNRPVIPPQFAAHNYLQEVNYHASR